MRSLIANYHHRIFSVSRVLIVLLFIAGITERLALFIPLLLTFMVTLIPTYYFRCADCGAYPYRLNQELSLFYPMKDAWDFFLHGPNLQCPHIQNEREGRS